VRAKGIFSGLGEKLGIKPGDLTTRYYRKQVAEVNRFEDTMVKLSNDQLRAKTEEFRERLKRGETEDDLLCEAFAVVREASKRVLGLRPFDSQLIGGMVLHDGKIAEMKTGEGKTLVAALPAYLNALSGKGAHVVTVNDYLAKRDAENIGQVHKALGMTVGIIQSGMTPEQRRVEYACDITYATNSEIGFDYLRDNLAQTKDDLVLRDFNFCVIDEADSILIDEARTPLIISGPADEPSDRYATAARLASILIRDVHYTIDEKKKEATLTEDGLDAAEEVLQIKNLDGEGYSPYITLALKAKELFLRDKEYIVKDGEILIVDEFTGRTMPGRRWSGGQHQAIEAKEGVKIQRETTTIASITYQNLFRGYGTLSGMTGTGDTEAGEFFEIYDMFVNVVPTNRPNRRKDYDDAVYASNDYKFRAVVNEVQALHESGRPILVGTTSVDASEAISQELKLEGINHEVLNAKPDNIERESEIIAQSGRKGAVTIATNMAGRGTDILLGGNADFMARIRIKEELMPMLVNLTDGIDRVRPLTNETWKVKTEGLYPCELSDRALRMVKNATQAAVRAWGKQKLSEIDAETKLSEAFEKGPLDEKALIKIRQAFQAVEAEFKRITNEEKREVVALGGLHVIGTERHESRRIDNQLRGRSGRQGDPGSTRFFLGLDDPLFRIFGGDKIKNFMVQMDIDDRPLDGKLVKGSLDEAQEQVESYFFGMRKTLFDYDVVLSTQRESLYENRRMVLIAEDVTPVMVKCAEALVDDVMDAHIRSSTSKGNMIPLLARVGNVLRQFVPQLRDVTGRSLYEDFDGSLERIRDHLKFRVVEAYFEKFAGVEQQAPGCANEAQRYIFLQNLDRKWKNHLKDLEEIRNSVQNQMYAQRDPLVEYKIAASDRFEVLVRELKRDAIFSWLKFTPPPNLYEALRVQPPTADPKQDEDEDQSVESKIRAAARASREMRSREKERAEAQKEKEELPM